VSTRTQGRGRNSTRRSRPNVVTTRRSERDSGMRPTRSVRRGGVASVRLFVVVDQRFPQTDPRAVPTRWHEDRVRLPGQFLPPEARRHVILGHPHRFRHGARSNGGAGWQPGGPCALTSSRDGHSGRFGRCSSRPGYGMHRARGPVVHAHRTGTDDHRRRESAAIERARAVSGSRLCRHDVPHLSARRPAARSRFRRRSFDQRHRARSRGSLDSVRSGRHRLSAKRDGRADEAAAERSGLRPDLLRRQPPGDSPWVEGELRFDGGCLPLRG
jgi:hypothetical protein